MRGGPKQPRGGEACLAQVPMEADEKLIPQPPWAALPRPLRALRGMFYGWWIVIIAAVCQSIGGGLYSTGMTVYFLPVSRDLSLGRAALSLVFTLRSLESGLTGPWVAAYRL